MPAYVHVCVCVSFRRNNKSLLDIQWRLTSGAMTVLLRSLSHITDPCTLACLAPTRLGPDGEVKDGERERESERERQTDRDSEREKQSERVPSPGAQPVSAEGLTSSL